MIPTSSRIKEYVEEPDCELIVDFIGPSWWIDVFRFSQRFSRMSSLSWMRCCAKNEDSDPDIAQANACDPTVRHWGIRGSCFWEEKQKLISQSCGPTPLVLPKESILPIDVRKETKVKKGSLGCWMPFQNAEFVTPAGRVEFYGLFIQLYLFLRIMAKGDLGSLRILHHYFTSKSKSCLRRLEITTPFYSCPIQFSPLN